MSGVEGRTAGAVSEAVDLFLLWKSYFKEKCRVEGLE